MAKKPKPKKVPSPDALKEKTDAQDKAKQLALKNMSKDIERLYENFFLRAKATVGKLPKDGATTYDFAIILADLNQQLIDAGLPEVQEKFGKELRELTDEAIDYFAAFGVAGRSLAGLSPVALDAFIVFKERELATFVEDQLVGHMSELMFDGIFGNLDRQQIFDSVSAVAENMTTAQIDVMISDSFAAYQRTVQREVGEYLGMDIYQYLGPDDDVTSEQCEEMLYVDYHGVPGMLYKDEITVDLHPKLRRDPLIGGGHPNCRHHWRPVSLAYAIEQGFETDEN